jgi:hypothetical protein
MKKSNRVNIGSFQVAISWVYSEKARLLLPKIKSYKMEQLHKPKLEKVMDSLNGRTIMNIRSKLTYSVLKLLKSLI